MNMLVKFRNPDGSFAYRAVWARVTAEALGEFSRWRRSLGCLDDCRNVVSMFRAPYICAMNRQVKRSCLLVETWCERYDQGDTRFFELFDVSISDAVAACERQGWGICGMWEEIK